VPRARQACAENAKQREQRKNNGKNSDKKLPRGSTTDPQARVIKMANGGSAIGALLAT
jgi:hypothetical protein